MNYNVHIFTQKRTGVAKLHIYFKLQINRILLLKYVADDFRTAHRFIALDPNTTSSRKYELNTQINFQDQYLHTLIILSLSHDITTG